MKKILVNTPKGQFSIPLKPVAENRADYYATEKDGHEKGSPEYNEEVDFVMDDDFEGIDWLINNTDWKDWEDIAVKENDKVLVTDDYFWTNSADFEIVES